MNLFKKITMVAALLTAVAFSLMISPSGTAKTSVVVSSDCADALATCSQRESDAYQACISTGVNSGVCKLMAGGMYCDCMNSYRCGSITQCDSQ